MFDSYSDDAMSELGEPLVLDPNYWDSEQRFDDDEAQSTDDDARLDNLSEGVSHDN